MGTRGPFLRQCINGRLRENDIRKCNFKAERLVEINWCLTSGSKFVEKISKVHPTIQFTGGWSKNPSHSWTSMFPQSRDALLQTYSTQSQRTLINTCTDAIAIRVSVNQPYRTARSLGSAGSARATTTIYQKRTEELQHHLVNRGYRGMEVQRQIDRASGISSTAEL